MRLAVLLLPLLACAGAESDAPPSPERWRSVRQQVVDRFPRVVQLDTEGVRALLDRGEVELVDVRRPDEFAVSRIPGARNVPSDLDDRAIAAAIPRDRPVVVYCSVGWRSADVTRRLTELGYDEVRNYLGSIFAWANEGLPLEDDHGATRVVHPYSESWGELLRPELRAAR